MTKNVEFATFTQTVMIISHQASKNKNNETKTRLVFVMLINSTAKQLNLKKIKFESFSLMVTKQTEVEKIIFYM